MGKLIKNHLARLIVLTAAAYQVVAAVHGFFWRKIFRDFLTKRLDRIVNPPIIQTINLILSLLVLAWEWPVELVAGTIFHQSIRLSVLALIFPTLIALLLYQATNAALYYTIGIGVYFWAYRHQAPLLGSSLAQQPHSCYAPPCQASQPD
ncbi:hypothetical protein BGZ60DRAFT_364744 [Tricladium varicosporioides]|nr:hypothetical protein BGZ60DRAFT_364744 [Hymenoscyphus varicosporioides]